MLPMDVMSIDDGSSSKASGEQASQPPPPPPPPPPGFEEMYRDLFGTTGNNGKGERYIPKRRPVDRSDRVRAQRR
jgi:hypothetical protein